MAYKYIYIMYNIYYILYIIYYRLYILYYIIYILICMRVCVFVHQFHPILGVAENGRKTSP